jgi:RNA polymerase sigma factor (sigma-70 family)
MPNRLLDTIRRAALLRDGGGLSDGQLLALFVKHRDGDAFEALLNRHGPMVMGVCRRVLLNYQDAEDAFQATFLIFARKAGAVNAQDSIAGWLYRVAYRTALEARARIARRSGKEQQVDHIPHPTIETDESQRELLALLDKEIDRLPDKYRVPVVLCEIEGRSSKEVARLLGVPGGTLAWRLSQAKKMLAKRLARHGMTLSVGALATTVTEVLSPTLRASTVKAVLSAASVPTNVLALTEGVLKAMLLSKLKITACAAVLMLLASVGATGLTYRATAQQPGLASQPQSDELEALRLEIEALRKSLQATRERVKTLEGEVSALKGQSRGPQGMGPGGGVRGRGPSASGGSKLPGSVPQGPGPGGGRLMRPRGSSGGGSPPSGEPPSEMTPPGLPGMPAQGQPQGSAPGGKSRPPQRGPGVQPGGPPGGKRGFGPPGGVPQSPNDRAKPASGEPPSARTPPGKPGGMMRNRTSDPVSDAEAALKKLRENPGDTKATEALEWALKRLKEQKKPEVPGQGNRL